MGNKFEVSYVTTLPKLGNAPRVTISGNEIKKYRISFYDLNYHVPLATIDCSTNETAIPKLKQWYTNWYIQISDESNNIVFTDVFKPKGKNIFIKMDAWALGDNIAWMPYVEEFRKKHQCNIICSTFYNDIFIKSFPEILFIKPNSQISNIYAQYYIGATNDENPYYSPIKVNENPLQCVASRILGLDSIEINPNLKNSVLYKHPRTQDKYVCISEYGSTEEKYWVTENGWQSIVDFINSKGYRVYVISKEPTKLINVVDLTGNISLEERMVDLMHSKLFIGVSSGLSWLSWAMGTHTLLISDVTPNWHEFKSNVTRVNANNLTEVNYKPINRSSIQTVINELENLL